MKRTVSIGLAGLVLFCAGIAQAAEKAASHRVAVCYFHRTQRCPTCIKIGALVEKSVDKAFRNSCETACVELHMIDFQAEKNKAYAQSYNIKGPTLIVMDIKDGKVGEWKNLSKIWTLVDKEDEFKKYVRGEAKAYADGK